MLKCFSSPTAVTTLGNFKKRQTKQRFLPSAVIRGKSKQALYKEWEIRTLMLLSPQQQENEAVPLKGEEKWLPTRAAISRCNGSSFQITMETQLWDVYKGISRKVELKMEDPPWMWALPSTELWFQADYKESWLGTSICFPLLSDRGHSGQAPGALCLPSSWETVPSDRKPQ